MLTHIYTLTHAHIYTHIHTYIHTHTDAKTDGSSDAFCIDDAALQRKWDWTFR